MSLVIVALSATLVGCDHNDDATVWRAQFPSPGGQWIATAATTQNGGSGSADIARPKAGTVRITTEDRSTAGTTSLGRLAYNRWRMP